MGGLKDWWDKLMGNVDKEQYEKETGLSEPSEEAYDDYHEKKADMAAEQRDPGLMHMGDGDR